MEGERAGACHALRMMRVMKTHLRVSQDIFFGFKATRETNRKQLDSGL